MPTSYSNLADLVLSSTQGFFGETVTYTHFDSSVEELKAVFDLSFVEINGVSTQTMTCQIIGNDLSVEPRKGDTITRDSKVWTVSQSQQDARGVFTLILKD